MVDENSINTLRQDVEDTLIGIFMQDDECALEIMQKLGSRDYFLSRRNKELFDTISELRLKKQTCDIRLLKNLCLTKKMFDGQSLFDFIGGDVELMRLYNISEGFTLQTTRDYIELIIKKTKLNRAKDAAHRAVLLNEYDEEKLVEIASQIVDTVMSDPLKTGKGLIRADLILANSYEQYLDRLKSPEKYDMFRHTGFTLIDRGDVIARGETTVIGARTNVGKSLFLGQLLLNLANSGAKCLLFSPELQSIKYTDRWIINNSDISGEDWKYARLNTRELKKVDEVRNGKLASNTSNIYIDQAGDQTVDYIINSVRRHMLTNKVDVVAIDHLHKLVWKHREERVGIGDNIRRLVAFAKDNNIALIGICILKRGKEPEPTLDELYGSVNIQYDVDNVILIHRISTADINLQSEGWYELAKVRNGSNFGRRGLKFNIRSLVFNELDAVQDISNIDFAIEDEDEDFIEKKPKEIKTSSILKEIEKFDKGTISVDKVMSNISKLKGD